MTILKIKDKEYKIKFGYNCFCDTDLMDKVNSLMQLMNSNSAENDADINTMVKIKDLFCVVRELVYVGFQKHNPVNNLQEVGNLLDDYVDDNSEKRSLMSLFAILADELTNEGFLAGMTSEPEETED